MSITASAPVAGVMGWPVSHSLSPRLHNHWLAAMDMDGAYVPLAVRPGDVASAISRAGREGYRGLNVTVPHKEAALAVVDTSDDLARRIGAVNTIVYDDKGRSHGTNTDGFGFIENINQHHDGGYKNWGFTHSSEAGRKARRLIFNRMARDFTKDSAVVLGAGGAARAVVVALLEAGVPEVRLCNRTPDRAENLATSVMVTERSDTSVTGSGEICSPVTVIPWKERGDALAGASLLVNTTTLGMTGKDALHISLDQLPEDACVNDIVYTPLETPLLRMARQRGNPAVDGLGMLIHQASGSFEKWFGQIPAIDDDLRHYMLAGLST